MVMKKRLYYTENETERLMREKGLENLSMSEKIEKLLHGDREIFDILATDVAYHPSQELIDELVNVIYEERSGYHGALHVLALCNYTEIIPYLVSRLVSDAHLIHIFYSVDDALFEYDSGLVINEIKQQLSENPDISLPRVELLLRKLYRKPSDEANDTVKSDIRKILEQIATSAHNPIGYLISHEERSYLESLFDKTSNAYHMGEALGTFEIFDYSFAKFRTQPITPSDTSDHLLDTHWLETSSYQGFIFQLGVVECYKDAPERVRYYAPFEENGYKLWENYRKQLQDILCGISETYKKEQENLRKRTENSLIILAPIVMSTLNLPPKAAGIAVVLSLMILKLGLDTLCTIGGDIRLLKGHPEEVCKATGHYVNPNDRQIAEVYQGINFPTGSEDSEWLFVDDFLSKQD